MTGDQKSMPDPGASSLDDLCSGQNAARVEYLQRAVDRLLMKNETLQFELTALRERAARIERVVFDAGTQQLRNRLPNHLLQLLRDLCRHNEARDQPGTSSLPSGKVIYFRSQ